MSSPMRRQCRINPPMTWAVLNPRSGRKQYLLGGFDADVLNAAMALRVLYSAHAPGHQVRLTRPP